MKRSVELDIRPRLRSTLLHLYPDIFNTLHAVLGEAEDFEWLIQMHAVASGDAEFSGKSTIYLNEEISHNAQLILQEIMDDLWTSYLCFQNGFTKQAQSILRSTLELIVHLYYLKYLNQAGSLTSDSWAMGQRGVERFAQSVETIKKMSELRKTNLIARLNALYNRLSTSAHSLKDRLAAVNAPRAEGARDIIGLEPLEVLYTAALFWSVLDLTICMIQKHLEKEPKTAWLDRLRLVIARMSDQLEPVRTHVDNSNRGYLIHREHVILSGNKQVLYSMRLNKRLEFPGHKKPKFTDSEADEFKRKVQSRFIEYTKTFGR
jgi:hypothetical protein